MTKVPKKLIEEYSQYEWHTLSEIFENKVKTFLEEEISPEDIIQGSLGSCYFLSAVGGIIKSNPELLVNLFITSEENNKGIYAVKFFIQGLPQVIVVDDFIPCKWIKNKLAPAFSISRDNEVSIIILEKAWSKMNYKCYMKTWLGTPQEALGCLTEAPTFLEYHGEYRTKKSENSLWIKLCEASLRKWILCANTEKIKGGDIGLPTYHAFTILDVFEVPKEVSEEGVNYKNTATSLLDIVENNIWYQRNNDTCLMLLKIRNPNGDCSKFRGQYHEGSSNWTESLRRAVGNSKGAKPGTFFITIKEFVKYFSFTYICKLEEKYTYRSASFAIEKGQKLIEYKVYKENSDLQQVEHEGADYKSWNSNVLEDDNLDKPDIIGKRKEESTPKEDNLEINMNSSNNNYAVSPISKLESNPLEEVSIRNSLLEKKNSISFISNIDDQQNTINELNDKLIEPKVNQNHYRLNNIIGSLLIIEKKTNCFVTLHQPENRFNFEMIKNYQVPLAFIIIANYNPETKEYRYINSGFINSEKLILECYLFPGEYHIFAKSYWTFSQPLEHRLVLSTYADNPCDIYQLEIDEISPDWIDKIMIDMARTATSKIICSKLEDTSYYSCIMPDNEITNGFGIFYFENNSLKGQLVVNIIITKSIGIKFLSENNSNLFGFILPPKTSKYLLYQIIGMPWECELKYKQEMWFEYPVQYLTKKFVPQNPEDLPRKEVAPQLYLSEIKYDRGYLIMIVNNCDKDYIANFSFSILKNFVVDNNPNNEKVEKICKSKSYNYFNIKCNKQEVDPEFKMIYESNFTLV